MEKLVEFKRNLYNKDIIERLKNDNLFKDKLLKDIQNGVVYPTIREDKLNFYYCKRLLFDYEDRFMTNSKFAFVPKEYKPTYVADGKEVGAIANFYDGYENIKERAKLYASPEDKGVSNICRNGNVISNLPNGYIVLDIEVAFEKEIIENNKVTIRQNRIDILLYGIEERQLRFVEAKHFSNGEIKSTTIPNVVGQIKKYDKELEKRNDEILYVYAEYIKDLNKIFDEIMEKPITAPISVLPKCGLIIFGFDDDQKNGRLQKNIESKIKEEGISVYSIGKESKIDIKTLYNRMG